MAGKDGHPTSSAQNVETPVAGKNACTHIERPECRNARAWTAVHASIGSTEISVGKGDLGVRGYSTSERQFFAVFARLIGRIPGRLNGRKRAYSLSIRADCGVEEGTNCPDHAPEARGGTAEQSANLGFGVRIEQL